MSTRRLATWVVLDGTAYGPHSDLTAEQAARITNPLAWADEPAPASTPCPHSEQATEVVPNPAENPASPVRPVATPPPRAGRGSGTEMWAAFATAHHVEVPMGADRAVIIVACEQAGLLIPSEN